MAVLIDIPLYEESRADWAEHHNFLLSNFSNRKNLDSSLDWLWCFDEVIVRCVQLRMYFSVIRATPWYGRLGETWRKTGRQLAALVLRPVSYYE